MVLKEILPSLKEKWQSRNHRPLPESVQFTLTRFEKIWIADGSTLEALFKKLKSLENVPKGQLAGKIGVVVDLMTRLPVKVWHSYLTSVLEPEILPPYVVADLYGKRWRIEEAFNTVKRLLGLSYLWVGSNKVVKLQIWGTWLFYAILIDLGDAVADELSLPFDRISLEMIYRGLYHFGVANQKGEATDPVKYFASPENKDLGIIKQKRKNNTRLIIAPFPEKQRNTPGFFFSAKSRIYAI